MAQKVFVVEGRQFRTEKDYARARHDKEIIDRIRRERNLQDIKELNRLVTELRSGKYEFETLLGQDFQDEVEELRKAVLSGKSRGGGKRPGSALTHSKASGDGGHKRKASSSGSAKSGGGNVGTVKGKYSPELEAYIKEELERRERRRKLTVRVCSLIAVCCLGYFGLYTYYNYRTESNYRELSNLKDKAPINQSLSRPEDKTEESGPLFTLDNKVTEQKEVLEEYINLYNTNKKLIGWVKIADTNIDYPVMQTSDNEYYLDHNLKQQYDKNGSIFMDKDCDVLTPSTNYILYGHHMRNGSMFGNLDLYEKESYYKEHPYIQFDTIYEKGLYQVMYVFRSRVYNEDEIVFKYYQFIDANSQQEFDSYMKEMADMSFYDTGVTAEFGDRLLTLSTCDYEEAGGRFVVVAKKIAKE